MKCDEAKIQAEIVKAYQAAGVFIFSVPNEAAAGNAVRQGQLITMGLKPGVSDLVAFIPGRGVTFIEVKTPTGKQSPAQTRFEERCKDFGAEYHLVRSVDDAMALI